MKKTLLTIIVFVALSANAQNIFREDFSTFTSSSALNSQNTWSNQSPSGLGNCSTLNCATLVTATPISYTGWGNSTKSVELKNDSDSNGKTFTSVTSSDVFIGIVINVSNASGSPQDSFRVTTGAFATSFRMYIRAAGGGTFNVGALKGSSVSPVYATGAYNYNENHLIIFKYSVLSGTNDDILNVYVDPNYSSGVPAIPSLSTTAGTDQTGQIKNITFRQNAATGTVPTGLAGLISVASTWADLSFVPLANEQFTKSTFEINANQANQGLLNIKSDVNLEKASLNIYDIQGRMIENKTISLSENNNEIAIKPISNSGIYIVEIVSGDKKIAQKIAIK